MIAEIEQLILKRRRKVYEVLKAKKSVKAEGYFIVKTKGEISEIMIPGVEHFITTPQMKNQLEGFIIQKWSQYSAKFEMELLAVVLMTDCKMLKGSHKKGEPIKQPDLSPCQDPNSIDVLVFTVRTSDDGRCYNYHYVFENGRLRFTEELENVELEPSSRLYRIWPIK